MHYLLKDKKFFIITILLYLLAGVGVFSSFALPLPFYNGVNEKSVNVNNIEGLKNSKRIPAPAQTHAGKEVFSFDISDDALYKLYLERFTSPEQIRWLESVLERADLYIDFIAENLQKNSMPPELLFLPVTESAYRHNAVSRSGAAGLWQFMKNSIAPYDMQVDDWVDERRDFWKATEGAIAKLKYNYEKLGNDWMLALAAYNCGLGRVQRTIEASGIRDYWQLCKLGLLPKETVHYIPRFMAITSILTHKGRYGLSVEWRTPYNWERVKIDAPVSVSKISEVCSLPVDVIKLANAELRYDITPAGKNYFLKVPLGDAEAVKKALDSSDGKYMKFYFYQIKHGDTIYDIAKHYSVSVNMIENYNKGLNSFYITVGQKIIIPALKDVAPYKGKTTVPAKPMLDDAGKFSASYVVKQGDTLWSIAKKYSTDPYNVAYYNGIDLDSVLSIGMELKVPKGDL